MTDILRFSGGTKWNPDVDQWLADQDPALSAIALEWFSRLRECGDDVLELIHDGCPVALVGDAPFGYVNVFKAHVNLGFFRGASLGDPQGLLEGGGKHMRHIKLRPAGKSEPDKDAVLDLVRAAYADIQQYC